MRTVPSAEPRPTAAVPTRPAPVTRARGRARAGDRYDRSEVLTAALFVLPAVTVLGIFVLYPILSAARTSLTSWNGYSPTKEFVGLANYTALLHDPALWNSLGVTVLYAAGVSVLGVVSGLAVALLLDSPIRARGLYRGVYFLPAVTSSVAAAIVWRYLFDPAGWVNTALGSVGVEGPDWLGNRWLALTLLTLLTVWKNLGFNVVLYLTGLQALPTSVFEAAQLDGANLWQRIRRITVPLLRPITFFVVIQALITTFQAFDLVYVLTGGGPRGGTEVLGMFMYREAFRLGNFGYGTAIAFATLFLVLAVSLVQWRVSGSGRSSLR